MVYRVIFALLFISMVAVRNYYQGLAAANTNEGNLKIDHDRYFHLCILFILFFISCVFSVAYIFYPKLVDFAAISGCPATLRLFGVCLSTFSTLLLIWTHITLADNFFGGLKIKSTHQLIISGPYRYVRHPMYLSFLGLGFGYLFLTSNLGIGLIWTIGTFYAVITRFKKEERNLLSFFDIEYEHYKNSTGAFIPIMTKRRKNEKFA